MVSERRVEPTPPDPAAVAPGFWAGKRVLLTGHTGFKGSWLSLWLHALGADVVGYALPADPERSLFALASVEASVTSIAGDVRDLEHLARVVAEHSPDIAIHMAAQALVRASYQDPVETYATNVLGTVHLLEAVRRAGGVRVVLNVTSDKCYENRETRRPYREDDPMGGSDPYSSSKGAAELVTSAYRRSFFPIEALADHGVALASARAGNVVGGGDFAADRLVVDVVHAFMRGETPVLRNPNAVRPWQFVLEPLSGYLRLAQLAYSAPERFTGGWNFGPEERDCRPVAWVVDRIARAWGIAEGWRVDEQPQVHEAQLLLLDAAKARRELGWRPILHLEQALDWTVEWYRAYHRRADVGATTRAQIERFAALPAQS